MGGGLFKEKIGCIKIENNVFVGARTTILADVHIGSNVIIGACSLVNKDLKGGYVYAGVPARKICSFNEFINKRRKFVPYSSEHKRRGDSIDSDFSGYLWKRFYDKRRNK